MFEALFIGIVRLPSVSVYDMFTAVMCLDSDRYNVPGSNVNMLSERSYITFIYVD